MLHCTCWLCHYALLTRQFIAMRLWMESRSPNHCMQGDFLTLNWNSGTPQRKGDAWDTADCLQLCEVEVKDNWSNRAEESSSMVAVVVVVPEWMKWDGQDHMSTFCSVCKGTAHKDIVVPSNWFNTAIIPQHYLWARNDFIVACSNRTAVYIVHVHIP